MGLIAIDLDDIPMIGNSIPKKYLKNIKDGCSNIWICVWSQKCNHKERIEIKISHTNDGENGYKGNTLYMESQNESTKKIRLMFYKTADFLDEKSNYPLKCVAGKPKQLSFYLNGGKNKYSYTAFEKEIKIANKLRDSKQHVEKIDEVVTSFISNTGEDIDLKTYMEKNFDITKSRNTYTFAIFYKVGIFFEGDTCFIKKRPKEIQDIPIRKILAKKLSKKSSTNHNNKSNKKSSYHDNISHDKRIDYMQIKDSDGDSAENIEKAVNLIAQVLKKEEATLKNVDDFFNLLIDKIKQKFGEI